MQEAQRSNLFPDSDDRASEQKNCGTQQNGKQVVRKHWHHLPIGPGGMETSHLLRNACFGTKVRKSFT
jgi:hypothetical protein